MQIISGARMQQIKLVPSEASEAAVKLPWCSVVGLLLIKNVIICFNESTKKTTSLCAEKDIAQTSNF